MKVRWIGGDVWDKSNGLLQLSGETAEEKILIKKMYNNGIKLDFYDSKLGTILLYLKKKNEV